MSTKFIAWLVTILISLGLGGATAWWLTRPAIVIETPAAEVSQADGSIVVARAPDAAAKPKQQIPKGATVERVIHIEAQGQGIKLPGGEVKPCPPVSVDLSLVREKDGGKRVIASSPDGAIVGAVDIPIETAAAPPEPPKWAVGASYNPVNQTAGLWAERDLGRVRLGVDVMQARASVIAPMAAELRVRVGWAF